MSLRNMKSRFEFSPGTYYLGDLCYVMSPEWDEICGLTIEGNVCKEGVFTLADGRTFGMWHTAYGDGTYTDNYGRENYFVDSGTIGIVNIEDISDKESLAGATERTVFKLGQIEVFDRPFEVYCRDGFFSFGHINIDTNYEEDQDEEYDYDAEDEDEYDSFRR